MTQRNDIVIGTQLGDEGKGATTAFLASQTPTNYVVKFSGGPQTAHNVITNSGEHHTFAQFGSATLQGVPTIVSKTSMINPFSLIKENDHLSEILKEYALNHMFISENSLLNTPLHGAINKLREIGRGGDRHGSCGWGVGETRHFEVKGFDAPRIKDLRNLNVLREKLQNYVDLTYPEVADIGISDLYDYSPTIDELIEAYANLMSDHKLNIVSDEWILEELIKGYNIFEGTQGVLLDEHFGFWPHTTWTSTVSKNALLLTEMANLEKPRTVGCIRSYATRHGHGPLPSEFIGNEWEKQFPEKHNKRGVFQGGWRGGYLDLPLFRYAVQATEGVDILSISHLDYPYSKAVTKYGQLDESRFVFDFEANNATHSLTKFLLSDELKKSAELVDVPNEDCMVDLLLEAANLPTSSDTIRSYGPAIGDRKWVQR